MLLLCGSLLVATTLLGSPGSEALWPAANASDLKQALSLPGTDVCCLTDEQTESLACAVAEHGCRRGRIELTLADLIHTVKLIRNAGAARGLRLYPGKRTLHDVCREIGTLARREQRYEREGRRREITASLQRVCSARCAGASEEELCRLEHQMLTRGRLLVTARSECEQIHRRMRRYARLLVAGEKVLVGQADARGMTVDDFLASKPTSVRPAVQPR
jgi:hypothetical protein